MVIYKELVRKISVPSDKKIKQKAYLKAGSLPVIDQGHSLIGGYTNDITKAIECDYPVIVFGDHTKCVKFITFPFAPGADGIKVLGPKQGVLPKYLYYGIQYLTFRIENKGYARHYQHIEKKELAVPPVPEQERIVSKIEELFSKLDAIVAELQTAKEKLKVYRQAVLKEAFTRFTPVGLVEISEIVEDIRIGPFGTMLHKADYVSGGVPVINPQHIKNLSIFPSEKVTVSQEKYVELAPYQLKENDIIMGRRGEMGRAAAITKVEAGWLCGTGSILFRLKPEYDATFYSQILSSPDTVHYLEDHATGTTMKNLNESIVKHIPVPKVTKQMQEKIVSKLEENASICDSIEQTIDASLQQAEALRQSILKQAFEGRL